MNDHWHEILRPLVEGRRWLLGFDVLAACTPLAQRLDALGAERSLCVGGTLGVGALPDPEVALSISLELPPAPDSMTGLRRAEQALGALPASVQRQVDAWDPDGTARSIGPIFSNGEPIGGRAQLGPRPASWQALEDKTVIDALWDAAGVPRVPSHVVPVGDLRAALVELGGERAVIAADNKEGFHGGASHTRSVRTSLEIDAAERFFAGRARRVRVMPYLDGVPCSIHGIVFPDRTSAFRPMEMVVLRRPDGRFLYTGTGGWWTPDPAVTASMRGVARKVGEHLRSTVGYRGAFCVDGVLTADGFRPTELNPRVGAALSRVMHTIDTEVNLLNRALVEGWDLDWQGEALEDEVMSATEARRTGHGVVALDGVFEPATVHVRYTPAGCLLASPDEAEATLTVGPGPTGSILSIRLHPERTPIGPSVAPRVAAALKRADAIWALRIGPVEPA